MKLGLDARPLFSPQRGIGVYMGRLIENLLALDSAVHIVLHFRRDLKELFSKGYDGQGTAIQASNPGRVTVCERRLPPSKILRWIWNNSDLLPLDRTLGSLDIYHSTNFVTPPLKRARAVVTIYDLIMLFPEFNVHSFTKDQIKRYIDRADTIIAISEHTKRDIMHFFDVPDEKVRVTLLAADERYRRIEDAQEIRTVLRRYEIDGEYILYTGPMEYRKNVPCITRAYAMLKAEKRIPHKLVLAGNKGGGCYEEVMQIIHDAGLGKDVIFTGFVADEALPYLYNGADVFAFPSFYEGFGLPPLEAMACGCPVVTSNTSSLPEVVGDAGLMVDPHRPEELAEAMVKILGDSGLRKELREKGLLRAATFSWERCARETLAVYREVLGKGEQG